MSSYYGINAVQAESEMGTLEIFDMYYAYLESRGVKVKSSIQEAEEAGFTPEEIRQAENIARNIHG